jgi:hypothetical protein
VIAKPETGLLDFVPSTPEMVASLRTRWPRGMSVPRRVSENLRFRRAVLKRCIEDRGFRDQVMKACSRDVLFWINCIAEGTMVVTDRGNVPIEQVRPDDLLWDGDRWVTHDGLLHKGERRVIWAHGIQCTPDHKIWTVKGWQAASEGHDRAEVRLPDGYSPSAKQDRKARSALVGAVRLRQGVVGEGTPPSSGHDRQLRMPARERADSRHDRNARLQGVATTQDEMRKSEHPVLQVLRRSRNHRLQTVGKVRELLRGHGTPTEGNVAGQNRQRRKLRAEQLSMGDTQTADAQHETNRAHRNDQRNDHAGGSGQDRRRGGRDDQSETGIGLGGRRHHQTKDGAEEKTVYDLLNCGPDHAFVVVDCDGRPLRVSNCAAWTYDPRRSPSRIPFVTWPFQDEAIDAMAVAILKGGDLAIAKSRDMGASWLILAILTWRFLFHQGESFLVASRTKPYVDDGGNPKSLFWKIVYMIRHCPKWMVPAIERTDMKLVCQSNDTVIEGESTTGNLARGSRLTAMLIDEFGAAEVRDSYAAMSSTRDATNCRIFNSTLPRNVNAFYDIIAQDQMPKIILHWKRHPHKAKGIYIDHANRITSPWREAQKKRIVSPIEMSLEVDCELVSAQGNFYPGELLADLGGKCEPPDFEGDAQVLQDGSVSMEPRMGGTLRVWGEWARPVANRRLVVGCDISMGTGASNSVMSFGDAQTGVKFAEWCDPTTIPERMGALCAALCRYFTAPGDMEPLVVWEAPGPGRIFADALQSSGHANLWRRQQDGRESPSYMDGQIGWMPTRDSKKALHGRYRTALSCGQFVNRSAPAVNELAEIVFAEDGQVEHRKSRGIDPSGARDNHGDRPTADALLWMGMRHLRKAATPVVRSAYDDLSTPAGRDAYWKRKARSNDEW